MASTTALAQSELAAHLRVLGETMKSHGLFGKTTQNPVEPQGFGPNERKTGALPNPNSRPETQRFSIINCKSFVRDGQTVKLKGMVQARYKGYDLFGDSIEGNLDTNIFVLKGSAKVLGDDAIISADTITVDIDAKTFEAENSAAQLRPDLLKGRVLQDVFIEGAMTYGSQKEIFGKLCYLTTCDKSGPHFHLDTKDLVIRPGKRMILRNTTIEVLGKRLFKVPYLSIPLEETDERYLPEVGQSRDQGYYVKSRWGLPSGRDSAADALVDYFSKLGTGLGAEYLHKNGKLESYLKLYALMGNTNTVEAIQRHLQSFGRTQLTVENNYQKQNYFNAPENTILNTRVQINMPQGMSNSRFSYSRIRNDGANFNSTQQTATLNDQRLFGRKTRTSLDLSYVNYNSQFTGGSSEREQMDVRFRGSHDLNSATAELEFVKSIPIGETTGFFGATDRTPVLYLKSDAQRLLGRRFAQGFPFTTEVSVGEFGNFQGANRITRTNLDLIWSRPDRSNNRTTFNVNGRLRQGFYSDDTAQVTTGLGAQYRYRLGSDTSFNLRYNYLRPNGFTPLQIDRVGRNHMLTADLSVRPMRPLQIGVQSGYDFLQENRAGSAWQQVGVRAEFNPSKNFQLRGVSTYDPFLEAWNNVRLDATIRAGGTFVSAGARYDGIRHIWGNLNLFVDGFQFGRLKTSSLLIYNGYLKKFEAKHFAFTYDLHCAEAVLQVIDNPVGFRSGREVLFFIRLKAFPFNSPFGTGRRGQGIGTGTGRNF